ncbi:hypothetical protein HPB52_008103 [Rhipicephalus sanguineus]|uniref:Tick transposon n=1 Tax=Rhipicephalus sanguineus TaxID=34632 RepID=A0A9D4QIP2_RHISA|nr:hypothetical protein HPB52_008103 [Rhipicephalus sanguineus]
MRCSLPRQAIATAAFSCRRSIHEDVSRISCLFYPVLLSRPGVAAIRINHKRNIVAADVTTRECLGQLLALTELQGISVTAKEPADRQSSIGFLHGVDGKPDSATLLTSIQSSLPVLSATREGSTVTVRLAGPVPPQHLTLFLVGFLVRLARPRPLQCRQCGCFGHTKETCSWPNSCIRCGRAHPLETECRSTRCVNCGGPHPADTPACPRWQQERKVATSMASSTTALSRRAVRAVVREEGHQNPTNRPVVRSHASVVQGTTGPADHIDTVRATQQLQPAGTNTAGGPAVHGPVAPATVPPAATIMAAEAPVVPGPDAPIPDQQGTGHQVGILLLAMQAASASLPAGHPLRNRRRPSVLQWNALSLQLRKRDLSLHLRHHDYDVLALQEVGGQPRTCGSQATSATT